MTNSVGYIIYIKRVLISAKDIRYVIYSDQARFFFKKIIINNSANCVPLQRMDQESSYQSMLAWSARGEIGTKGRDLQLGTRRCRSSVKRAGRRHRRSVVAVDDVRVPAGRAYVAEHEEHQGDHHRQQEPLGVQAAGVTSAVVVAAVAPHAAARSHGGGRPCVGQT